MHYWQRHTSERKNQIWEKTPYHHEKKCVQLRPIRLKYELSPHRSLGLTLEIHHIIRWSTENLYVSQNVSIRLWKSIRAHPSRVGWFNTDNEEKALLSLVKLSSSLSLSGHTIGSHRFTGLIYWFYVFTLSYSPCVSLSRHRKISILSTFLSLSLPHWSTSCITLHCILSSFCLYI